MRSSGVRRIYVVVGIVVVVALAVGYWGLSQYVPTKDGLGNQPWDLAYYDLQLFTLSSDALQAGPPFNPWLEVARYLVPIVGATTLLSAILRWFTTVPLRFARRHVVVVGRGTEADTIAAVLRGRGHRQVLQIPSGDAASLQSVGIKRAAELVVCGFDTGDSAAREALGDEDDSPANLTAANTAVQLRGSRPGLTVHILVRDADLALALRARRLVRPDNNDHPVYVYTMDELAARRHMRTAVIDPESPHLLVIGGTGFGQALIVEYALRRRREGRHRQPAAVTLVDEKADQVVAAIVERYPFVRRVLDLTPVTQSTPSALRQWAQPPTRIYFCSEDEGAALAGALAAAGHWQPTSGSIVVRLNRLRAHSQIFSGGGPELFDDLGHALDFVTVPESATEELESLGDPMIGLARGIHERYLYDQVNRGRAMGSSATMVPWERLTAESQRDNLNQARDFPVKLAAIRATVAPRNQLIPEFIFTADEVELLAMAEHERWTGDKLANRWSYGEPRDERRRLHPLLKSWDDLGKAGRDVNRDIVREVPLEYDSVLELQGMQIIRLAPEAGRRPVPHILDDELTEAQVEELARAAHAAYLRDNPGADGPAARPWESLDENYRDASRNQARGIGQALALINTYVSQDPAGEPFEFTEAEIDVLAQFEHRRWMAERQAAGWTYAEVRDDPGRQHPDLLDWDVLPEPTRVKDRQVVLAIPELLGSIGYYPVRRRVDPTVRG